MCGNQPARDRVQNHHCISELDLSSNTLTLNVNLWLGNLRSHVDNPPGETGTVTYRTEPLVHGQNGTLANFKRAFVEAVDKYWNDKLWIEPALPDPSISPVQCRVSVAFVTNHAHAHCQILMLHDPKPAEGQRDIPFRSNCNLGGASSVSHADMVISYPMQNRGAAEDFQRSGSIETSDRGAQPFVHNVAAHEFGHYLGLNHRCFSPGSANAEADYCIGRTYDMMNSIMAVGTAVTEAHGEPWYSRLAQHHHRCDTTWVGATSPTQHHAGLINSLAAGS